MNVHGYVSSLENGTCSSKLQMTDMKDYECSKHLANRLANIDEMIVAIDKYLTYYIETYSNRKDETLQHMRTVIYEMKPCIVSGHYTIINLAWMSFCSLFSWHLGPQGAEILNNVHKAIDTESTIPVVYSTALY